MSSASGELDLDQSGSDGLSESSDHSHELMLPVWEATGDPDIDATLDLLLTLDDVTPVERIEIYETVHQQLHKRLSHLSNGP